MKERPLATVGALIVAPDGDILLVRSKKWHDLFSLPGGKVELGETREEALRREIWEETGLKVGHVHFAIVQDCIFSPEFYQPRHFIMHDFIARLDSSASKEEVKLNDEAYTFCWIQPKQALELPLHRECRHLIEWYLAHSKFSKQGWIGFSDHQITTIVGIHPKERLEEQTLFIDGKVNYAFAPCLVSGHVKDTIDYTQLTQICTQLAHEKKYLLLETFASDILDTWLTRFPISRGWIKIKKPAAVSTADYTFIELERYCEE